MDAKRGLIKTDTLSAIIIHGADYVSEATITATGRIGRSLGCPAVENRFATEIVEAIANSSLMIATKTGQADLA